MFFTIFLIVFMFNTVYANFTGTVDFSSSTQGDLKKGDEFTVIISLKDNTVANDYLEFVATLTYDTDCLELLSQKESVSSTGWDILLYNDTLFAYGSSTEGDIDIISLTFKVKDTEATTTSVSLSDICVAEGNLVCYFDDSSLSFTIAPEEEKPDSNDTVNNGDINNGEVNNGDVNNGKVNNGEINNGEVNNGNINNGEINNGEVNNGKKDNTKITNKEVTNEKINHVEVNHVKVTTNEETHNNVSSLHTNSSSFVKNSTTATINPSHTPANNTAQIILREFVPESDANSSTPATTFSSNLDNTIPTMEGVSLLPIYILFGITILLLFMMILVFALRKNPTS